jgi:capsular polysaccharide biosynthesis protein/Mrp family chromosome partitioning ATPase
VAVARRWWWTLLIATWVAGLAGYLISSGIPPTYEGEAKLLVGPVVGTSDVLRAAASISNTYSELATSKPVLDKVLARVGLPAGTLIEARALPNETTRILDLRAQHGNPRTAAALANAMAAELIALQPSGIQLPEGQLTVVDSAQPPVVPIAPQPTLIALVSAATGLLAAGVLVMVVEYFGSTVNSTKELSDTTDAPVLGSLSLGRFRPTREAPVVVQAKPTSRAAASARLLAMRIAYAETEAALRTVLIVGTAPNDGSADFAGNIATVLESSGRRVLLVDANEEFGELTALFGLDARMGDLVRDVDGTVHAPSIRGTNGLELIPAGQGSSAELVDPETAGVVLGQLTRGHELVILHAAPIHLGPSAIAWARTVDATVLVAERDRAKRADVGYAAENLRAIGGRFLGSVLVDHAPRGRRRRSPMPERSGPVVRAPSPGRPIARPVDGAIARPARERTVGTMPLPRPPVPADARRKGKEGQAAPDESTIR